jgi:hypothetical protein
LREVEPYFWDRLPFVLELGYRQAEALQACAEPVTDPDAVPLLGAAFTAAIVCLDYIVDERAAGHRLFSQLTDAAVASIFTDPGGGRDAIDAVPLGAADQTAIVDLMLALVRSCGAQGRAIYEVTGDDSAWRQLGTRIGALLVAERSSSEAAPDALAQPELLAYLELKSVGPTLALLDIVRLANGVGRLLDPRLVRAAASLGRALWLVDDLADLLVDARRKSPNALFLRYLDDDETRLSDSRLYEVIEAAAEEISGLLNDPAAFGLGERREGDIGPQLREVRELARFFVATWLHWPLTASRPHALPADRPSPAAVQGPAVGALRMLLDQHAGGLDEMTHRLRLPVATADGVEYEEHPASVGFHAVILDALLDARAAGLEVPNRALAAEGMTLLRAKHPRMRGGWSYFNSVPTLPPDADELGQVLQALSRLGGRDLACTCDEAVRLALDAVDTTGGFPTWILDPAADADLARQVQECLLVVGGAGVHAEVVANLLGGLLLHQPERYAERLIQGLRYLEMSQEPDGSWHSKWYAGRLYAAFKVAVVLRALAPAGDAAGRLRDFVLDGQLGSGAWREGSSTTLPTAHAILALASLGTPGEATSSGLEFLAGQQEDDGGWCADPWIQFATTDGVQQHGSRTLTTAFALKALLAGAAAPGNANELSASSR